MERFQFVSSFGGVRLAVSTQGDGPATAIMIPFWFSHMPIERQFPPARAFFDSVFPGWRQVYYDRRGIGLSDRNPSDFSLDAQVSDLEAVVDSLGLSEFVLFGPGDGGCVAISYAALHPERVSRLILYGTYRSLQGLASLLDALAALISVEWDLAAQAIAQLANPGAEPEASSAIAAHIKSAATSGDAVRMLREAVAFDVTPYLGRIQAPTLVLHRRGDRVVPFEAGRELAICIPTARFVPLDGDCHTFVLGDIDPIAEAVTSFLETAGARGRRPPLPEGPITILFTDMEGSTALTQYLGDAKAREVLRAHERIVREALQAHGGLEVKAMGDGFMASFSSATRALECAIAMQQAFAAYNESEGTPIRVRIGLNVGEPIAEDEDFFGTAVIMAARVVAEAQGGEILVSDVVRQLVAGRGFLFADRGETVLRGFDDPVRLFEVRWQG